MLNQLFAQNNYRSFNVKLAHMFGLEAAVYLNELIAIYNCLGNDNFVQIDREYIRSTTTITPESQKSFDKTFNKFDLVEIQNDNTIKFNYDVYISIFNEANDNVMVEITNKITKKRTKSDLIKDDLKKLIKTDNGSLRDGYSSWIDSVFAKQGWMSKKSVELGQKLVDEYSKGNIQVALEILDNASIGGYRDIQWAINSYEEKKKTVKSIQAPKEFTSRNNIQLAQEVF